MQFIVESTKELWAKKAADIVEETIKSSEKPVWSATTWMSM